ncbi:L,D-transpeptidase catalytic domain [Gemmobacter aquatilis]|uniref:L,D-transpeptidase catalytic domain n=1 Tax=Gemmobacter aquatilis TaxID=933059 RepID=A0A1H7YPB2_9RHOB|nr:L,D-transpeptidase family protein [Gemmobacter aquatilis]SEM47940.1 L,D-transpeptidase catalytic domain [Gemmobacter aquatilis]
MTILRVLLALVLAFGITACGQKGKFRSYDGPSVTSIQVHKAARKMYLLHNSEVLEEYDVALGFTPVGHKQFEGDGKTPEGTYFINRHNPNSRYHLSLGISYPNREDKAFAEAQGKSPGGDIMIHGRSDYKGRNKGDWTAGCIAVTDKEMEVVYSMVRRRTPVYILP